MFERSGIAGQETSSAFGFGNGPRGNDVARDAAGSVFQGYRGHKGVDGCFRRGDVALHGHAGVVEGGGDVDDACVRALEEVWHSSFDGVEGAEDVDVHDGFEGVGAHAFHGDNEVTGCSGTVGSLALVLASADEAHMRTVEMSW